MMPRIPPLSAAILTIDVPLAADAAPAVHRATEAVAHKLARELWLERLPATWAIDAQQTPCLAERIAELPGHEHALLAGADVDRLASQLANARDLGRSVRTLACSDPALRIDPAIMARHGITAVRLAGAPKQVRRWWQQWPLSRPMAEWLVVPQAKALRWGLYEFCPVLSLPHDHGRVVRVALEQAAETLVPAVLMVDAQRVAAQGQSGWSAVRSVIDELAELRSHCFLEVLTIADVVNQADHGRGSNPTTSALRSRAA